VTHRGQTQIPAPAVDKLLIFPTGGGSLGA
jgi:hypothetical protein